jgi:hypothetical protein
VRAYYETVHIASDHGQIARFMSNDHQIRHEPGLRDGVEEFKQDLERLVQNRTIDEIALLVAEGDCVFIAAGARMQASPAPMSISTGLRPTSWSSIGASRRRSAKKPKAVLFVSGDDRGAKAIVVDLINSTGVVAVDLGSLAAGAPCSNSAGHSQASSCTAPAGSCDRLKR